MMVELGVILLELQRSQSLKDNDYILLGFQDAGKAANEIEQRSILDIFEQRR